ncbi:MAG: phage tail protein [Planctomycetota bacterium]|jgi:microcystin-dependent protein
MSEPFVGQITMFAGNFAPRSWAFCDGQLLQISQNDALFSLLGTIYGGDGRTNFGLPDLRGRIPIHQGSRPGGASHNLGSKGGGETVTVTAQQLPTHSHTFQASTATGNQSNPSGACLAGSANIRLYRDVGASTNLAPATAFTNAGGSQAHTNVAPFQCIHYIIALVGIYPSRN